jgi:hypothetical protein
VTTLPQSPQPPAALVAAIDADPFDFSAHAALADFYRETGLPALADAAVWVADNHRAPLGHRANTGRKTWLWWWYIQPTYEPLGAVCNYLPACLAAIGYVSVNFSSPAGAVRTLVHAVAGLLPDERGKLPAASPVNKSNRTQVRKIAGEFALWQRQNLVPTG